MEARSSLPLLIIPILSILFIPASPLAITPVMDYPAPADMVWEITENPDAYTYGDTAGRVWICLPDDANQMWRCTP